MNDTEGYFEGFYDAADLEPLFDDASPEYREGWLGYHKAREAFEKIQEKTEGGR